MQIGLNTSPGKDMRDYESHQARINDYATRSFRDIADGDYIAARMAFGSRLVPQFLWSSQQALEKYLKYILLVNRIPSTDLGHDLDAALSRVQAVAFPPVLSQRTTKFFGHVAQYGTDRYLEGSFHLVGSPLYDLDRTVWEIRRVCQRFGGHLDVATEAQHRLFEERKTQLEQSDARPTRDFRLAGGFLEKVLDNPENSARLGLLWQNAVYGDAEPPGSRHGDFLHATNSPLYLYPEMIDDLADLVRISPRNQEAWRWHRARVRKGFSP